MTERNGVLQQAAFSSPQRHCGRTPRRLTTRCTEGHHYQTAPPSGLVEDIMANHDRRPTARLLASGTGHKLHPVDVAAPYSSYRSHVSTPACSRGASRSDSVPAIAATYRLNSSTTCSRLALSTHSSIAVRASVVAGVPRRSACSLSPSCRSGGRGTWMFFRLRACMVYHVRCHPVLTP